jgi:LysM repeat protein
VATYRAASGDDDTINVSQSSYNLRGQLQLVYHERPLALVEGTAAYWGNNIEQQRSYDAAGRLIESRQFFSHNQPVTGIYQGPAGWIQRGETYAYDADGRVTQQLSYNRIKGWAPGPEPNQTLAYQSGVGVALSASPLALIATSNSYYDSLGRTSSTTYAQNQWSRDDATQTGSAGWTQTFVSAFEARESYLDKTVTGSSTNSNYRATTSTSTYDRYGRRIQVQDDTVLKDYSQTLSRLRYFAYDAEGGILQRRDGELKNGVFTQVEAGYSYPYTLNQHYVYANGQQIARSNEAGQVDAISGLTAYDQGGADSVATVQSGDTLAGLAQRIYGNSSLWYVLAAANGVANDNELVAGTVLKVPNVSVSKNDASTFKPYNPAEIIGPTTPSLPYIEKPAAAQCSAGMIIMIIVAVVTYFTAGAASAYFASLGGVGAGAVGGAAVAGGAAAAGGAVAGGAVAGGVAAGAAAATIGTGALMAGAFVGGLVGSIAGQVVGKALGVVDHFSLRQAVGSGIANALTAGIAGATNLGTVGKALENAQYARAAGLAVLNGATSYAGNRIAGVQDTHFSWKSVAASAVTSLVVARIDKALGWKPSEPNDGVGDVGSGDFGHDLVNGGIGGVVGLHVRRALGFDDAVNYGMIAADAFGNALGNAAVRGMQSYSANKAKADWASDQAAHDAQLMAQDDPSLIANGGGGSFLDRYPAALASNETSPSLLEKYSQPMNDTGQFSGVDITLPGLNSDPANNALAQLALDSYFYGEAKTYSGGEYVKDQASIDAVLGVNWNVVSAEKNGVYNVGGIEELTQRINVMLQKNEWPGVAAGTSETSVPYLETVVVQGQRPLSGETPIPITGYQGGMTAAQWHADSNRQLRNDARALGNFANQVLAPTIYEARQRGVMPTRMESFSGTLKYGANLAIGVVNLASYANPGAWIARARGEDPTISPFKLSNGEVTQAAVVEGALLVAGPVTKALQWANGFRRAGQVDRAVANSGVWRFDPFRRGQQIEQAFGHNLPNNFPTIDRFNNGLATSIKSLDLDAASYQGTSTLNRMLTGYVDKVAGFQGRTWAGVRIRSQDVTGRALDLVIPHSGSAAQQAIISQSVKYGASRGVTVNVITFP